MSLNGAEFTMFHEVADELRETFAERGYRVDQAMELDPAFGSGRSRSSVARDLAVDSVTATASRLGLDPRRVCGGGLELRSYAGSVPRSFRFLRGKWSANGELVVTASSDSALAIPEESLFRAVQWVLAWILDAEGQVRDVLAAEILGFVAGRPGRLRLGPPIPLGHGSGFPDGFRPTDEGLDGFELDTDDDELGEAS